MKKYILILLCAVMTVWSLPAVAQPKTMLQPKVQGKKVFEMQTKKQVEKSDTARSAGLDKSFKKQRRSKKSGRKTSTRQSTKAGRDYQTLNK